MRDPPSGIVDCITPPCPRRGLPYPRRNLTTLMLQTTVQCVESLVLLVQYTHYCDMASSGWAECDSFSGKKQLARHGEMGDGSREEKGTSHPVKWTQYTMYSRWASD